GSRRHAALARQRAAARPAARVVVRRVEHAVPGTVADVTVGSAAGGGRVRAAVPAAETVTAVASAARPDRLVAVARRRVAGNLIVGAAAARLAAVSGAGVAVVA